MNNQPTKNENFKFQISNFICINDIKLICTFFFSFETNKKKYTHTQKTQLENFFVGDELLEFHQAVVSTLRDADDVPIPLDSAPMTQHNNNPYSIMMQHANDDLGRISDVVHTDQDPEDDLDPGNNKKI